MIDGIQLRDAFNDPASRVQRVVSLFMLTDATDLKLHTGEVNWLPTFGWFFDQVVEAVTQHNGEVSKFLADGVVATYSVDNSVAAINAGIVVQERLRSARQDNTYRCNSSVGISAGTAVQFRSGDQLDYIGTCVDKAMRLAEAANAGAIFVDDNTVGAANMMQVFSVYGNATNRDASGYLGKQEKLPAPGFAEAISYHEILWDAQPYGIKTSTVTGISAGPTATRRPPVSEAGHPGRADDWTTGRIDRWFGDRQSGVVACPEGDHYLHMDHMVGGVEPQQGAEVYFVAAPPTGAGKNPRATVVLVRGTTLGVRLAKKIEGKGFGFAEVTDASGASHDLFIYLRGGSVDYEVGAEFEVTVDSNRQGPIGKV